mgnify:CR=1 FL=1
MERVKNILAKNYVRPDEAEKIKSKVRETGRYTVIDNVSVKLNEKRDVYEAYFSNLGIKNVIVEPSYVKDFEKLLCGGIWCILQMEYEVDEYGKGSPFKIVSLKPIQMPNMDIEEIFQGRKDFTKDEWIDTLIRSTGMEPDRFSKDVKWHLLARLIPMVENNYNVCELGPRRRVKEQLKKIGGMEFYDVNFSYIDNDTQEEHFVSVPEMGGGKLIPEGMGKPGHIYTVATGDTGRTGVFKMELQAIKGSGKYEKSGLGSSSSAKESINIAFQYFKASAKKISGQINTKEMDYHLNVQDLQGVGMSEDLTLSALIALCSGSLPMPVQESMAVLGTMSIGGTIKKVSNLADTLQVCFDAGAKRIIMPASNAGDIGTVPAELFSKFQINFYSDPEDAVRKSLGKM